MTRCSISNHKKINSKPTAKIIKSMFDSVVAVAFRITFRVEMHANIFFILKKLFLISAHQNDSKYTKHIKFFKKNNLNFLSGVKSF
jgi:saccharopine dehydrogenase-like NADP-dependent oxidoreductase